MLYTVVATPRSGSTSLCKRIASEYNAKNLGEVFFPLYGNTNSLLYRIKVLELIETSRHKDIVIKVLMNKTEFMGKDTIVDLLRNSQKIFYSLRLDHVAHVKSVLAGQQTRNLSRRKPSDSRITIHLEGNDVEAHGSKLLEYVRTQGQWYKEFPGELCILDHWGKEPYHNTYDFVISKSTKEFLNSNVLPYIERKFDVLTEFYKGSS